MDVKELADGIAISADKLETNPPIDLLSLESLDEFAEIHGVDYIKNVVLPQMKSLMTGFDWRARIKMIRLFPSVVKILLATEDRLEDSFASMIVVWLSDPVAAVREEAATVAVSLSHVVGPSLLAASLIPQLQAVMDTPHTGHLQAYIHALEIMAGALTAEETRAYVLPPVLVCVRHAVVGVRISTAAALTGVLQSHLALLNDVKPSLQTLYGDDDPDVKEAAEAGLKFC